MSIKAVFLGGPGVGKSSIIKSYTEGHVEVVGKPTVSAAFVQKDIDYEGQKFELGIWDTAGAEQYRSIAPIYFRSANIAFIVADASDSVSDSDAEFWARELVSKAEDDVVIIFVMNKIDLVTDTNSLEERCQVLSKNYGEHYCLTSALNGTGINEMFAFAFNLIPDVIAKFATELKSEGTNGVDLTKPTDHNGGKKCFC